ncbi:hypothetical protein V8F33_005955 [Rhypophila sp. PSN 637]
MANWQDARLTQRTLFIGLQLCTLSFLFFFFPARCMAPWWRSVVSTPYRLCGNLASDPLAGPLTDPHEITKHR